MQIALTFRNTSELLKCSDLQLRQIAMYYITRRCTAVGNVPHLAMQGVSTVFVLIARFGHTDGDSLLYRNRYFQ